MKKPEKPFAEWSKEEREEFNKACERVGAALAETRINWPPMGTGTIIMLDNLFKEEMNGIRSEHNKGKNI